MWIDRENPFSRSYGGARCLLGSSFTLLLANIHKHTASPFYSRFNWEWVKSVRINIYTRLHMPWFDLCGFTKTGMRITIIFAFLLMLCTSVCWYKSGAAMRVLVRRAFADIERQPKRFKAIHTPKKNCVCTKWQWIAPYRHTPYAMYTLISFIEIERFFPTLTFFSSVRCCVLSHIYRTKKRNRKWER